MMIHLPTFRVVLPDNGDAVKGCSSYVTVNIQSGPYGAKVSKECHKD